MSREELIELVEKIAARQWGSEEERVALIEKLEESVIHPYVADLIFLSDPPLSPEEIVDRALTYRPIAL